MEGVSQRRWRRDTQGQGAAIPGMSKGHEQLTALFKEKATLGGY